MSHKTFRTQDYLGHMLEAIQRIDGYVSDLDEVAFLNNRLIQDAVIRNIEVLGEAANHVRKVDPVFAHTHSHIPWEQIYTMRNRITHGYHSIDMEMVWKTVARDLPVLYEQIIPLVHSSY